MMLRRVCCWVLAVCLVLFGLVPAASGTAYYFDLASGNDTTGDGSAGNPWKTIDKCTTSRSAGDECRGAKTTITTLSGTLTFTNGSTSVATSADLTAVVAANDVIGKNSGLEGWWKVSSLNSTTITLTSQYWGISGSGSAVTGYKITPVAASEEYDLNSSGTAGSLIKISGGWDLAGSPSPVQDGITCFSSTYTNAVDLNAKDYVEVYKFIIVGGSTHNLYSGVGGNDGAVLHDLWLVENVTYAVNIAYPALNISLYNIVATGGTGVHFHLTSNLYVYDSYSFSCGTGTSDNGLLVEGFSITVKNVKVYNTYHHNLYVSGESAFINFVSCVFDTTRSASTNNAGFGSSAPSSDIRFYDCTFTGATHYAIYQIGTAWNVFFIACSITAGSTGTFFIISTYESSLSPIFVRQNTGADSIMYFSFGEIEQDSSADCRSGKCLKFTPNDSTRAVIYKIGNVKIPSAGSDITLSAYMKDDSSFNGSVWFTVVRGGKWISKTEKTPTTSYVKQDITVSSSDLAAGEYLDLYVEVVGTAGNLFIDDFSAAQ